MSKTRIGKYYLFTPPGREYIYIGWSQKCISAKGKEYYRVEKISTGTKSQEAAEQELIKFVTSQEEEQQEIKYVGQLLQWYKDRKTVKFQAANKPKKAFENLNFVDPAIKYFRFMDINSLKGWHITRFSDWLRDKRGASNAKIRNVLTYMRAGLNDAAKQDIISKGDVPHFELPEPHKPRELTMEPAQIRKLITHTFLPHVRLYILLLLFTLVRKGAIMDLTWARVNFTTIKGVEVAIIDYICPLRPRERNKRRVEVVVDQPILVEALKEAKKYAKTDSVMEYDCRPVHEMKRSFKTACKNAGLGWVTPHVIRHTGATLAISDGMDPHKVAELMGDNYETVIKNYVHLKPDYTREVVQGLGEIYRLDDVKELRVYN